MSPIQMSLEDQLKEWKSWSDKQIAARDLLLRRAVEALRPFIQVGPGLRNTKEVQTAIALVSDIEQTLKGPK